MNKTVSFTQMKHGTHADYQLLHELEKDYIAQVPDRLLRELARQADDSLSGYQVNRLEHALQSATRAHADGAEVDWVVAALLHDIGDGLAPQNHDRFAAEVLRPYVREEVSWVVAVHGVFQMVYFGHHLGWNPNEREIHADNQYYQSAVDFCERWDQNCFDPDFEYQPLEFFRPMLEQVFSRKAWDAGVIQSGVVRGLPPSRSS